MNPAPPALVDAFRLQSRACAEMGSPFTSALLEHAAASLERAGPLAALVGGWAGDPVQDALPLRLAGALHALVQEEADDALAAAYPRPDAPGRPRAAWRAAEAVIAARADDLRRRLQSPPQTNETRRSLGLFPGLLVLADGFDLPLDLYELGASAGLNLNMDRFAYRTAAWAREGASAVLIDGDWRGPPPPLGRAPRVRGRAGCDQNPLDPASPADRLRLRGFVWADQFDRLARLEAALDLAAASGTRVDRADAAAWLAPRLRDRPRDAVAVIYHSVFWQYPPQATREAIAAGIAAAGAEATADAPLAWLRFEPEIVRGGPRAAGLFRVTLTAWPGGEERRLAEVDPHARWVAWAG